MWSQFTFLHNKRIWGNCTVKFIVLTSLKKSSAHCQSELIPTALIPSARVRLIVWKYIVSQFRAKFLVWATSPTKEQSERPGHKWDLKHIWAWTSTSTYRVVSLGSDGADGVRVPDDQVGIWADGNPTLTRVQVQDLSCVGAGDCHKHVLVHLACSLGGEEAKQRTVRIYLVSYPKLDEKIALNLLSDVFHKVLQSGGS